MKHKMAIKTHPLPTGKYTDRFGERGFVQGVGDLGFHYGLDIAAPLGTPIYAAHDGRVRYSGYNIVGGYIVYLTGSNVETSYQHLRQPANYIKGQTVKAGEVIGYVGNTGASTGPHLHFELWVNGTAWNTGTPVNPEPYLNKLIENTVKEKKVMSTNIGHYIGGSSATPAKERSCVIFNVQSGFYTTWSGVTQEYINNMARAYNTGNFIHVTKKHWDQTIKPMLDSVRLEK